MIILRDDVWERIDNFTWSFAGYSPFNIIRNAGRWRLYFSFCVICAGLAWVVLGFDSTWSMAFPFIENLGGLLNGSISLREVWDLSQAYYGVGNHFSAIVIYGSMWVLLSRYYESIGIKKSLNFCITTGLSLSSIGVFEWVYNSLYAYYQGQQWVVTWQYKQVANLVSFTIFAVIGGLVVLYMVSCGYKPRTDKWFKTLLIASVLMWFLWVWYPFGSTPVNVVLVDGSTYTSTGLFPQTYYAVDVNPWDNVAIGEPHYMQNDLLHLVNTLTKIVSTVSMGYFSMWKKQS